VQAATTTRFSPFSRIVLAICAAASVEQMNRPPVYVVCYSLP